jgi:hypothetical protein
MLANFSVIEGIIEDGIKKKIFRKTDVGLLIMTIFGTLMIYINGNHSCFAMVGAKNIEEYMSDEFKERVKIYLKNLLQNQLSKQ